MLKIAFYFAGAALYEVLISTIRKQMQSCHLPYSKQAAKKQHRFFKMDTTCNNQAVGMTVLTFVQKKIPI